MVRFGDPVPLFYALLALGAAGFLLWALVGTAWMLVLAAIFVPMYVYVLIREYGESRFWW